MAIQHIKPNEQEMFNKLIAYQKDPCGFGVDVLGIKPQYIWSKMREVAESVRDNQFTAVPAGHDVSKTFNAGRLIIPWFKSCFQPSTIITTAPSDNQVRNQLWREIHAAYKSARIPLGGDITSLLWDCKPADHILKSLEPEQRQYWEKNFAIGFSTSPDTLSDTATKMQGWHNLWMLIVLDEAGGILPQIWKTVMESLVVNERVKVLAIGNPTEAYGYFADALETGSGWNVIRISCKDTPNYIEGREVVPGVAGRSYVERMARTYGEDSQTFKVRVEGKKPQYSEGTFYGKLIAEAQNAGRIRPLKIDRDKPVHTFHDVGDVYTAIGFVQFDKDGETITPHCVDFYYDCTGAGIPEYAAIIKSKGYKLGRHFFPPDTEGSNRKNYQTGRATRDVWLEYGFDIEVVEQFTPNAAHDAARMILPTTEFDIDRCSEWITMLAGYRKKKDLRLSTEDRAVYTDEPIHDSNSHGATMFELMSLAARFNDIYGVFVELPSHTGIAATNSRVIDNAICVPNAVDDESDLVAAENDGGRTI